MYFLRMWHALMLGGLCCAGATEGRAADSPCGPGYAHEQVLGPDPALGAAPAFSILPQGLWGRESLSLRQEEGRAGAILRVQYPQGSVNPGSTTTPRGGAGFRVPVAAGAQAVCLRYQVRFPDGFAFVRGGKLPGLYGGTAPTGCLDPADRTGFSARLMWRADGAGEVYLYGTASDSRCGASLGRGAFAFPTGRWVEVTEEVLPDPVRGRVRLWIDGQLRVDQSGLALSVGDPPGVGLLFSTFFGGDDPSWASPRDQFAEFRAFSVWVKDGPP